MDRPPGRILFSDRTAHGIVEVVEHQFTRALYFGNGVRQTEILHDCPEVLVLRYVQAMMAVLLLKPVPQRVLMIGLGGGTIASFLRAHFPDCHLTIVEQQPEVVALAQEYFGLPQDKQIEIVIGDGAEFVVGETESVPYDLILVDAFSADGVAASLIDKSFYQGCQRRLTTDGAMAVNLWQTQPKQARRVRGYMSKVFAKQVWRLPVVDQGNEIILSSRRPRDVDSKEVAQLAELLQRRTGLDFPDMLERMASV